MNDFFRHFAHRASEFMGSPWTFCIALMLVIAWALSGPYFNYSGDWQLVINTGTTVLTFLMVFLIQNTQTRDAKALHLKLDELLRAIGPARTALVDIEEMSDEELEKLEQEFREVSERARQMAEKRRARHKNEKK